MAEPAAAPDGSDGASTKKAANGEHGHELDEVPPRATVPLHRSNSIDNSDLAQSATPGAAAAAAVGALNSSLSTGAAPAEDLHPSDPLALAGPDVVIGGLSNPSIEEGTPAAAALRANADVKVRKLGKLARRVNAQTVRRIIKKASLRGNKRGKPPRVPPRNAQQSPDIYPVEEGEEVSLGSSLESFKEPSVEDSAASSLPLSGSGVVAVGAFRHRATSAVSTGETVRHGNVPTSHEGSVQSSKRLEGPEKSETWDSEPIPATLGRFAADLGRVPAEVLTSPIEAIGEHTRYGAVKDLEGQVHSERRGRRRKKRTERKDGRSSYVRGKVIDGEHELYTLSIAVMLGLRTSIGMTNGQLSSTTGKRRWLESDDFMAVEKYVFRPKGGPKTPPHQLSHTFKFKDYSPVAFAYLRRMFGVNEYDFLLSVCGNANFIEFISNAKSGQFFFYSNDGKYMIKTMTNAESKFLRRIIPHYFHHCAQNPNTLITRYLGMYRVKMYHLRRNVKFVIMNSVFDTDKYLQSFFDLKGSKLGRDAKPKEDVKKDNDVRRGLPDSAFVLPPPVRERVREQVRRDCEFLNRMKIMDYSMLIGVHHIPPKQNVNSIASIGTSGRSFRGGDHGPSFRGGDHSALRWDAKNKRAPSAPPISVQHSHSEEFTASNSGKGAKESDLHRDKKMDLNRGLSRSRSPNHGVATSTTSKDSVRPVAVKKEAVGEVKTPAVEEVNSMASPEPKDGWLGTKRFFENEKIFSDASVTSFGTIDQFFEDDDDYSYLEGANRHTKIQHDLVESSSTAIELTHDDGSSRKPPDDVELRKEQTTEQMYWPFHRFYDIHGRRRMFPMRKPDDSNLSAQVSFRRGATGEADSSSKEGAQLFNIPDFEPPLSNRKDCGFMMDTTGVKLPMKFRSGAKVQLYEGKIFYMGIIDVLQQFNMRKRFEARWRRFQGAGWEDASCVHPSSYGERFLRFFDEYTQRLPSVEEEDSNELEEDDDAENVEEITFFREPILEEEKAEVKPASASSALTERTRPHKASKRKEE